jgi:hypothetical protein
MDSTVPQGRGQQLWVDSRGPEAFLKPTRRSTIESNMASWKSLVVEQEKHPKLDVYKLNVHC